MDLKTQLLLCLAGVLIIVVVYLEFKKKGLNRFNSKRVGQGQHGTAQWADKKEIKKNYETIKYLPGKWRSEKKTREVLPQGLVVGLKNRISLIDATDTNTILIGPAGIGKTFFYLIPQIEYSAATGSSFVITDTKGEIYKYTSEILEKYYGYRVTLIDLRNPSFSEGYNLMQLVNKYMDLYKINKDTSIGKKYEAKAQKYAKIISKSIIETAQIRAGDTYFYDNAEGLLTSAILLISEFAEKEERHIVSVFKLIRELSGESDKNSNSSTHKSKFKELIEYLPKNHKTRWFTGGALDSHEKVTLSIFSTSLSKLLRFIDSELEQVICFDSSFTAETFTKDKMAIFFVLPEEDTTKHFLFSLFMIQLYRELLTIADTLPKKKFDNRIYFFMDEFGTLPAIENVEMVFSASRSRNILSIPIIQSLSQLEEHYGEQRMKIILDNCQNTLFSGFSPSSETAEYFSKALGTYTARSGSINRSTGNKFKKSTAVTETMIERPLMTADEIRRLKKGTFIYLKTGCNPIITKIPIFKKWGIKLANNCLEIENKLEEVKYVDADEIKKTIMEFYNIVEEPKNKEDIPENISLKNKNETKVKVDQDEKVVKKEIEDEVEEEFTDNDKDDNFFDF